MNCRPTGEADKGRKKYEDGKRKRRRRKKKRRRGKDKNRRQQQRPRPPRPPEEGEKQRQRDAGDSDGGDYYFQRKVNNRGKEKRAERDRQLENVIDG